MLYYGGKASHQNFASLLEIFVLAGNNLRVPGYLESIKLIPSNMAFKI